jgi:hypothetical protein
MSETIVARVSFVPGFEAIAHLSVRTLSADDVAGFDYMAAPTLEERRSASIGSVLVYRCERARTIAIAIAVSGFVLAVLTLLPGVDVSERFRPVLAWLFLIVGCIAGAYATWIVPQPEWETVPASLEYTAELIAEVPLLRKVASVNARAFCEYFNSHRPLMPSWASLADPEFAFPLSANRLHQPYAEFRLEIQGVNGKRLASSELTFAFDTSRERDDEEHDTLIRSLVLPRLNEKLAEMGEELHIALPAIAAAH